MSDWEYLSKPPRRFISSAPIEDAVFSMVYIKPAFKKKIYSINDDIYFPIDFGTMKVLYKPIHIVSHFT